MKKFILAALAASVATTPVLAQSFDRHNGPRFEQRHDDRRGGFNRNDRRQAFQYRNWNRGDRFDSRYARNYRVISNPRYYRLNSAPRGYRWVQSGNDAVLVGITTGLIASVLAGALN